MVLLKPKIHVKANRRAVMYGVVRQVLLEQYQSCLLVHHAVPKQIKKNREFHSVTNQNKFKDSYVHVCVFIYTVVPIEILVLRI